ncbi:hypothetical protein V6U77_16945 [Micromonospora sp. CPCC 205546]|uniref:hypothetical protein n=1 Tax=Micromonospora sp. CPCC 205546 TaxID=3122397 RepID=UPI002FF0CE4F
MFAGMSRGRKPGGRTLCRPGSAAERAEAMTAYQRSVGRLQRSAYRNLRQAIANAVIFFAVVAINMIFIGEVTPTRLPWYAASIVGGALGVSTYAVRNPRPYRFLLAAAVTLAVVGLAGAFVVE